MKRAIVIAAIAALAAGAAGAALLASTAAPPPAPPAPAVAVRPAADPLYGYEVVAAYPHDPAAFTQGLVWQDGHLWESTGLVGRSSIRKVALETGEVTLRRDLAGPQFGEGLVVWKDRVLQLTWQHQIGFIYDAATFAPRGTFNYVGEGWGLTHDGARVIMSDGSHQLRFLDPDTLAETGRIDVTWRGEPVRYLNELEWVKGEIWANVWQTDVIVRINPATGAIVGRIDLAGLLPAQDRTGREDVLNGIAYDPERDRIFVTGKQWPKLFEIRLVAR